MKIVRVTYTTQPGYAGQNQHNIQAVMSDLRQAGHTGIFYHVCLGADGKTFTHTAFFEKDGDEKTLFDLASFQTFQQQLRASSPEVPPATEHLSLVGSSEPIFNG
ncbi:MAG TPA: hypothetical protein VFE53_16980 [Mucilaginibacter sp.]|jgi:hypothetical protein|nr:hypothetical protein [Mucilaginibacter sp.]